MSQSIEAFPAFRPRWEKHLELWKREPAGTYSDIADFVHFVVQDFYPNGNTEDLQRAFDLMEHWLVNGCQNLRGLIGTGFLEDLQYVVVVASVWKTSVHPVSGPQMPSGME